jgi:hypothetical protein
VKVIESHNPSERQNPKSISAIKEEKGKKDWKIKYQYKKNILRKRLGSKRCKV